MKRLALALPVCAALALKLARWPYWYSVAVTVRSLLRPEPCNEADWMA